MLYEDWGFLSSPFQSTPLPPSDLGRSLLVGRDTITQALMRRIESRPQIPTIEGINGIGKTSVANVAAYSLYKRHIEGRGGPLYIPCRQIFQLTSNTSVQNFVTSVLTEVAQTLIERAADLTKTQQSIKTSGVDRWLNSPQLTTYSAGLWMLQGGSQTQINTSEGFQQSGLKKIVLGWLDHIFPSGDGGVICIIDNLELLQRSETARSLLEQLRDEIFHTPGLRWVICGALGIVQGVASSPRLEGYLHSPIELKEIDEAYAPSILDSRIQAYATRSNSYLPIVSSDFALLYSLLRGNLRATLAQTENYCQWVADHALPTTDDEKRIYFLTWLDEQCASSYSAAKPQLTPKVKEVFCRAAFFGGLFSPSDYPSFGFNSMPVFRPKIADLEEIGLVVSTQDESDKRRKTIQITSKGWLVFRHLEKLDPRMDVTLGYFMDAAAEAELGNDEVDPSA
jgi:hypothetical protein